MTAIAIAVSLKAVHALPDGSGLGDAALALMGDEWAGFSLDFLANSFAVRVSTGAEKLFGSGPNTSDPDRGLAFDFIDNSSALKV